MSARSIRRSHERVEAGERRRRARLAKRAGIATAAAIGSSVVLTSPAMAATFVVDTLNDSAPNDCATDDCTLREAVQDANGNPGPDTITFDDALAGTITLTLGQLAIDDSAGVTITDTGTNEVTISGNDSTRIFEVLPYAQLTVDGLGLTQGFGNGDSYGFAKYGGGGAILAGYESTVQVTNSDLYDNYAETKGGAISSEGATVTVTNSTITGNYAGSFDPEGPSDFGIGGGVASTGIKYETSQETRPDQGPGQASLTITGSSVVSDNVASVGGGVASSGDKYAFGGGAGASTAGDLEPSLVTLSVSQSEISGNEAALGGGSFAFYSDSAFTGANVSDNHAFAGGGIDVLVGGLDVNGTTISGNTGEEVGGGIGVKYGSSRIADSTVSGNAADTAGGVLLSGDSGGPFPQGGSHELIRSTIAGNDAYYDGAGLAVDGVAPGTTTTIEQSTISGNSADAAENDTYGGGLSVYGFIEGDLEVVNSTISGNDADFGGGVSIDDVGYEEPSPGDGESQGDQIGPEGSIAFSNSTIAANSANASGGGVYLGSYYDNSSESERRATISLSSTIAGDNTAEGAPNDLAQAADAEGGGFVLDHALVEAPGNASITQTPAGASILGSDPALGALANNGGPTQTHLPSDSSPAIDKGVANGLATDQRGLPRTVDRPVENGAGDGTDIGSVELQGGGNQPPVTTRALLRDEVPGGCGVPFDEAEMRVAGDASSQTLQGGPGDDILRGFGGDDTVLGVGGDDCLTGDDGEDTVTGDVGDDYTDGGDGVDLVSGNDGNDEVRGAGGDDKVRGQDGDDQVVGGGGEDRVVGASGEDNVRGRFGDDSISGGADDDAARGGGGDDKVSGGSGDNTLRGGGGDDLMKLGNGVDDVNCGKGTDEVVGADKDDTIAKNCENVS